MPIPHACSALMYTPSSSMVHIKRRPNLYGWVEVGHNPMALTIHLLLNIFLPHSYLINATYTTHRQHTTRMGLGNMWKLDLSQMFSSCKLTKAFFDAKPIPERARGTLGSEQRCLPTCVRVRHANNQQHCSFLFLIVWASQKINSSCWRATLQPVVTWHPPMCWSHSFLYFLFQCFCTKNILYPIITLKDAK